METPTVKVTMLGTTGSGKSTFMLGMYAMLSAGLRGYFVYTRDQDDHIDLTDAWDRLLDDGLLPPATTEESSRRYEFIFTQGFDTLLNIDWLDYRGGALTDRSTTKDARELHERLTGSDSVYLVLDGKAVGKWVRAIAGHDTGSGTALTVDRVQRQLKIQDMTAALNRAVGQRKADGVPPPSIVALITKMDTLEETSGLGRLDAIEIAIEHLDELLPVVTAGVTTLVSPVQLGEFGTEGRETVDTGTINPQNLHKPFVFTLMHYLTTGIEANKAALTGIQAADDESASELAKLRSGFTRSLLNRGRITALEREQLRRAQDAQQRRAAVSSLDERVQQLGDELRNLPIYRDGTLQ